MLDEKHGANYLPSMWIKFFGAGGTYRWCQPDGLILDLERQRVTIVEVKYSHVALAWCQTFLLYRPVVEEMFPGCKVFCTEVVRWYDPATVLPGRHFLSKEILHASYDALGVCIWNPKS